MIGVNVDIAIRDEYGGYYVIPVLPEVIDYTDGDGTPHTVALLDIGTVEFDNGVELDTFSLESFFPARYDGTYCRTPIIKTPIEWRNLFSTWKGNNTDNYLEDAQRLQIVCPAAGLNKTMKLRSFKWEFRGAEGDLYYTAVFHEYKNTDPIQIASGVVIAEDVREPEPVPEVVKEITVGSTVHFKGGPVFKSSDAANAASNRGEATCKCTIVYSGLHPFHLISSEGDLVYGWVNAEDCEPL